MTLDHIQGTTIMISIGQITSLSSVGAQHCRQLINGENHRSQEQEDLVRGRVLLLPLVDRDQPADTMKQVESRNSGKCEKNCLVLISIVGDHVKMGKGKGPPRPLG